MTDRARGSARAARSRRGRERLLRGSHRTRTASSPSRRTSIPTAATSARPSLFESTDGGTTFGATPLYSAPAGANVVSVEIARSNPMVDLPGDVHDARPPPPSAAFERRRSDLVERDVEAGLGANEFRILTVDPDDANVLYLRVIALGMESVMVTRDAGMTFATPVTDHEGDAERVRTAGERHGPGRRVVSQDGGGMTGAAYRSTDGGNTFVPWTLAPQPHILGLAERGGDPVRRGQELQRRLGAGHLARRRRDHDARCRVRDVRGISRARWRCAAISASWSRSQAVWTNDVCTGALLGRAGRRRRAVAAPGRVPLRGRRGPAYGVLAAWALAAGVLAIHRRRVAADGDAR